MDYQNAKDFSDEKTIIYGHNMRDGSMFAKLKKLDINQDPTAVLYTPDRIYHFQLYEERYVSPKDAIYHLEVFRNWPYRVNEKRKEEERILVLSTCNNDTSERHVYIGGI